MSLLFDLSGVPDDRTLNYHLDCLCKAMAEPASDKGDMWEPHPSLFLRQLVEAFTALGLTATDALQAEAIEWLSGAMHAKHGPGGSAHPLLTGSGPHGKAPDSGHTGSTGGFPGSAGGSAAPIPPGLAWSPADLLAVRDYLVGKPMPAWSLEDWLLLGDYLVHHHFPPGWAESAAEALATRAGLMAKVENDHPDATEAQIGNILAAMPNTVAGATVLAELSPAHVAAMAYGRARAAENIRAADDQLRHSMKSIILNSLEVDYERTDGVRLGPSPALQQRLFDAFADHNRDWRRIAVTEAGEIKNQGFVALQAPGSFVRRVEQYRGACSFCRGLDGRVFKVVQADDPDKDGTKEVWPGKTNIGRSASPNKRVGAELVPRLQSELWWAAAGVQHPHCRGVWVHIEPPLPTSSDKQWKEWLGALGLKST